MKVHPSVSLFTRIKCKVRLLPPLANPSAPSRLTSNFLSCRHFEIQFVFGPSKRQHSGFFHGLNSPLPESQQQMQIVCVYLVRCSEFIGFSIYHRVSLAEFLLKSNILLSWT